MDFNIIKENLNIIGLACNFIGAVFIFFTYAKDKKEYVTSEENMKPGEKRYSLFIKHPCFLKVGLFLLCLGFFLSIAEKLF